MTVAELITELQKLDPAMLVTARDSDGDACDSIAVETFVKWVYPKINDGGWVREDFSQKASYQTVCEIVRVP